LESHIAFLEERLASYERMLWACQNSTGWENGIKDLIREMDRLREQIRWERMKAADEAAAKAAHKAMEAEHEASCHARRQCVGHAPTR
jgi:hypothetical protein